ncbi:hypothetical protein FRC06_004076 [Ceratobasidium sp. 370]|nr:hypothetical protein FRC06_004076 [Ceratobasidium sp. 370]
MQQEWVRGTRRATTCFDRKPALEPGTYLSGLEELGPQRAEGRFDTLYDLKMFNGNLEDVFTQEEIEDLLGQDVEEAGGGLPTGDGWEDVPDDFVEFEFMPEELAAIDAVDTEPDVELRDRFIEATKKATGFEPRKWQVDVACMIHKGRRDLFVLAGTGYGKTLPFVMNCFLDPNMIVWIVSPLNYIEIEQAKVFQSWKLRAVAVNSMTEDPRVLKDIKSGQYQVVISSIESMTAGNKLRPALSSTKLSKRRQLLVVDEAHVLSSWTEMGFRPVYAITGQLRRLLPPGTPVLAATATANQKVRQQVMEILAFRDNPYVLLLGNHRPNIIHSIHWLKGAESAVDEIHQYFPSKTELPLALIFVDSRDLGYTVLRSMRDYVDPSVRGRIQLYHAYRTNFSKRVIEWGFRQELFRVLVCTEALTMGADFRAVSLVINFLMPHSVRTWGQRSGRGARRDDVTCHAIIMAQPSTRRGHKNCKLKPLTDRGSVPEREAHDVAAHSNANAAMLRAGAGSEPEVNIEAKKNGETEANADDVAGESRDMEADENLDGVVEDMGTGVDVDAGADVDKNKKDDADAPTADATGVAEDEGNVPKNAKKKAQASDQSHDREIIKKQRGRTHTKTILEFINHAGCLTKFLDKEYGNPPRPDETCCTTCRNCLDRERIIDPDPDTPAKQQVAEDVPDNAQRQAPHQKIIWLRPAARKEYEDELRRWRQAKWASPECAEMDIQETYLMSDKCLTSIARHPSILTVADLDTTSLIWAHRRRWGEEIVCIMKKMWEDRQIAKDRDTYQSIVNNGIKGYWKRRVVAEQKAARAAEKAKKAEEVKRQREAKAAARAWKQKKGMAKGAQKAQRQGVEGEIGVKLEIKEEEEIIELSGSKGKGRSLGAAR